MDDRFDCAGDAQHRRSRAAVLLRRLSAGATALVLAYLIAPDRPFDDAARFPMGCTGAHQDLAWTPLCHPRRGAARVACTDLEGAEREVQAARRT